MGTTRIGDRAVYEVTVRRVDDKTREQWTYPPIVTRASSVRGALTNALLAPLSRWHAIDRDEEGKR